MEHSNHHNDSGRRSSLVGTARAVLKQNPTLDGETHLPGGVVGRRSSNSVDLSSPLSTSLNRVPVQIDEGQSSHRRLSTLGGASGENSNRRLSTMSNAAGFSSTVTTVMNVQNFSQKLRRASMEAASSIFEAAASIAAMQEEKPPEPRNNPFPVNETKSGESNISSTTNTTSTTSNSNPPLSVTTSHRRASLDLSGRRLSSLRPPQSGNLFAQISREGSGGGDSGEKTTAVPILSSSRDAITIISEEAVQENKLQEGLFFPISEESELQVHCRCELHSLDRIQTADQTWSGDVSLLFSVSIPLELRNLHNRKLMHQTESVIDKKGSGGTLNSRRKPQQPQQSRSNLVKSTMFSDLDIDNLDPASMNSRSDDTDDVKPSTSMPSNKSSSLSRNMQGGTFYGLKPVDDVQLVDNLIKSWEDDDDKESSSSINASAADNQVKRLCLKTKNPSLYILPPQEWAKEHNLAAINDVSQAGREYIDLIEMHLLPIHLTNILGGESFVIDRTLLLHVDAPPAAVKSSRIRPGGPVDGSFSCFTLVKRYKATFRQMFSLYQFPLDTQWLIVECELGKSLEELMFASVEETSNTATNGRIFEEGKADMLVLEPGHCPALSEWDLHKRIICQTYETEAARSRSAQQFSRQRFLFKVRRKYGAYIENVGFTVFLIGSLTGMAWFIDSTEADSVTSRLNFLVTLLLSAVSFRFVVRSYLPTLSYMTLLDYYVRSGLIFITIACIEVAALAVLTKSGYALEEISRIDNVMWIVNGTCWGLYNLYCIVLIARHALSHNEKALYTDRTYIEAQQQASAAAMLTLNENDTAPPDAFNESEEGGGGRLPISSVDGRPYSRKNSKDRSHGNLSWISKIRLEEDKSAAPRLGMMSLSTSQLDLGKKYGWTFTSSM
jgi:hypothetical protein